MHLLLLDTESQLCFFQYCNYTFYWVFLNFCFHNAAKSQQTKDSIVTCGFLTKLFSGI